MKDLRNCTSTLCLPKRAARGEAFLRQFNVQFTAKGEASRKDKLMEIRAVTRIVVRRSSK